MTSKPILSQWQDAHLKNRKLFTVLVDPDKTRIPELEALARASADAGVDYFFVGGSLLTNNSLELCIKVLKANCAAPVIIFPGNSLQMSNKADAILFLSLISGRNAEMLIGRHVISAPYLKMSGLEIIPVGYMLIESGRPTAVTYMSNSVPIPADKVDIAACTALAGEMLGLQTIFMDAGSGAERSVSIDMIQATRGMISCPLIVGGGIRDAETASLACTAGADIIVVGNAIEKNPDLIYELGAAIHSSR
jgi:phosphoglycerol geranylgeranyltransferase